MRDSYTLPQLYTALAAWERHKAQWLKKQEAAMAPTPSAEQLESYRNVWIEGFLEAISDASENQVNS